MPRTYVIALFAVLLGGTLSAGDAKPAGANPLGTWRGQSVCVVKESACRDEQAVYRISASAQSQARVTLAGNKVVDGKEINMGTSDCDFDPKVGIVECKLPNGNNVHLEVRGDSILGTLSLADGRLWRRISLARATTRE